MAWLNGTRFKNPPIGWVAGDAFPPSDANALDDRILRAAGYRGYTAVAASEARNNIAYGVLGTPDRVASIVHPADGILVISFEALWNTDNVPGETSYAAIFIGGNQLKNKIDGGAPVAQEASRSSSAQSPFWAWVGTTKQGLQSFASGATPAVDSTSVTTGMPVGAAFKTSGVADSDYTRGGHCEVWLAAGTYDVEVRFKTMGGGNVNVKERRLWVESRSHN